MFRFWLKWAWVCILEFKGSLKVFFFFCSEGQWIFWFCYYCTSLFSWEQVQYKKAQFGPFYCDRQLTSCITREKLLCLRWDCISASWFVRHACVLVFCCKRGAGSLSTFPASVCSHPWLLPPSPLSQSLSPSPADAALVSRHTRLHGMHEKMCMWPKACPVSIAKSSASTGLLVLTHRQHTALAVSYRHKAHLLFSGEQKASAQTHM